ncbi:hypothetical protein QL285_002643 [Trifolium repens]|nr:hypothetical protein QL285_002643 [Trifolium repens]
MVEIFINYFSFVSTDMLVDRYIKWNNNNYYCFILNVDENCFDSPVRSGFDGLIRNTSGNYLVGFSGFIPESFYILLVELYAIYKGSLAGHRHSIDEHVCYTDFLHCVNFIKGP